MTAVGAHEAATIARVLKDAGQNTLAVKWKSHADELAKLEQARRHYADAANIVANIGVHVEQACKERGESLGSLAAQLEMAPTALYPLRKGKSLSPSNTVKVLRWLGGVQ